MVEITLLGQNVNAWHGDGVDKTVWGLGRLIRALGRDSGLARIRYTTVASARHGRCAERGPWRGSEADAVPASTGAERVRPYLAAMKPPSPCRRLSAHRRASARGATRLGAVVRFHRRVFRGETEEDFAATLDLIRTVGFASAYAFKYSPRPGTPASDLDDQIAEEEKEARLKRILAAIGEQSVAFNRSSIGRTMDVLLDRRGGRRPGQLGGRSPYMQAVHVDAPASLLNTVQPLRIVSAYPNSLTAEIVEERACA